MSRPLESKITTVVGLWRGPNADKTCAMPRLIARSGSHRGRVTSGRSQTRYRIANGVSRLPFPSARLTRSRLRGKKLLPVVIVPQPGLSFESYATPWEVKNSNLIKQGNRFTPVVDDDYTVIGHYGRVQS